jgi:hypothetical protein
VEWIYLFHEMRIWVLQLLEMLTHYFSCLGGVVSINITLGHVMLNLCFSIRCDLQVT